MLALLQAVAIAAPALTARADDRLPPRLRPSFRTASTEARRYVRFIIDKVFARKLAAILVLTPDLTLRRGRAARLSDEIVHLVLPQCRRILGDVLYGTSETHLGLTMPRRGKARTLMPGANPLSGDVLRDAIDRAGRVHERSLSDRLEQALSEDLADFVQREAEMRLGLSVVGRPREVDRPLPRKWRARYRKVRDDVRRFTYWWLRKRQRLKLSHMARTLTAKQIDAARYAQMWGVTSAISSEAWAQNRFRIEFRYGHFNWEVDRRRIRRRMDQDQAGAGWALTRLVREITRPGTEAALRRELQRRVDEALSKPPLRKEAERFPDSGPSLTRKLSSLIRDLDPLINRAMDRVRLPAGMRELAREHGRRYAHEELEGELLRSLQRSASSHAASKRVRERLPDWVAAAKSRLDFGEKRVGANARKRAIKRDVDPLIEDEIEASLRRSGMDAEIAGTQARRATIQRIRRRFGIDGQLDRLTVEGRAQPERESLAR